MLQKEALEAYINSRLEGTDYFLVDLRITPANEITVEIDSMGSVDIDYCIELTRAIEAEFSRDDEDYELEVGSAGFTSPFKVLRQYQKNIGNEVDVVTRDGKKLRGILTEADQEGCTLDVKRKVRPEGSKRPVEQIEKLRLAYPEIKQAAYHFEF